MKHPLRIGIGGPVGSGKTALLEKLCINLSKSYDVAAITNAGSVVSGFATADL